MGRGGGSLDVQDAMCTLSDMGDRGHEAGHTHGQEGFREQDETDTQKALPRRPPGLRGQKAPLRFAQCQLGQGQAAGKGAGGWGCSEAAKMPKKKRGQGAPAPSCDAASEMAGGGLGGAEESRDGAGCVASSQHRQRPGEARPQPSMRPGQSLHRPQTLDLLPWRALF